MKKLLVMLLALLLACGAILAGAAAEEQSPYTYTVKSAHTAERKSTDTGSHPWLKMRFSAAQN